MCPTRLFLHRITWVEWYGAYELYLRFYSLEQLNHGFGINGTKRNMDCIYIDLQYSGFDQDLVFTCTQRNLVIHTPVCMIDTSILISDYRILFAQVPVMFIVYNKNRGNFKI